MAYATYEEYVAYGGTLEEATAVKLLDESARLIDTVTYNRIDTDRWTEYQKSQIKLANCMLVDFVNDNADFLSSTISSYAINGVSMSFGADAPGLVKVDGVYMPKNAFSELVKTGLTYRGC